MKRTKVNYEKLIKAAELRRDSCNKCNGKGFIYTREDLYHFDCSFPYGHRDVVTKCKCQKEVDKRKLELADLLEGK